MTSEHREPGPFSLLTQIHGDRAMAELLDERHSVDLWIRVEVALAQAQASAGVIEQAVAVAIARDCASTTIDLDRLWADTRVVGYPILPLLNQLVAGMSADAAGRLHFGATTQDIMDTALALQLADAGALLLERLDSVGSALEQRIAADRSKVMAARTHAQQATPTTLGAKWAVFLAELSRHRRRLVTSLDDVRWVSLFGAGGTSAAIGSRSAEVRRLLAAELQLRYTAVPWHVSRDSLAALALVCAGISASTVRLAREIVDLSRTEVGEVSEARGHNRGASSTMPQKANPIQSEAIIGFGVLATSTSSAALRFLEAGHERAAGEWQVEWGVLPQVLLNTSSALRLTIEVLQNLETYPDRMLANLSADGGSLMSESLMISLAEDIGRDRAHELVYEAVRRSRDDGQDFVTHVSGLLATDYPAVDTALEPADPMSYLGEADSVCDEAIAEWRASRG